MEFVEVLAGWQEGSFFHTCAWLISLVAITFAWALWQYRDHALLTTPIPSSVPILPGGKPLIGHAVDLLGNLQHIHHWLLESSRRMGFRTYAFSLPTLHTFYMVSTGSFIWLLGTALSTAMCRKAEDVAVLPVAGPLCAPEPLAS